MSKIDDKHAALKRSGLDLGPTLAAEEDAGYGGRVRRYQNGNIYYHAVMGDQAREVHGGILTSYLAQGGPGPHPTTRQRHLGFPLSDEGPAGYGGRHSKFEWGEIWWVPGRGAITIHGPIFQLQHQKNPYHWRLGCPLTDPLPVAGGTAVYYERGCVWFTTAVANAAVLSTLDPPLLGRPAIIDVRDSEHRAFQLLAKFPDVSESLYNTLIAWRPTVFTEIWNMRLALTPVLPPNATRGPLPLAATRTSRTSATMVGVRLEVPPTAPRQIAGRTLYDLAINLPNGKTMPLAPHCFYAAGAWEDFGILHITDTHISRRNEQYRDKFMGLGRVPAASGYDNFQDGMRAFITYANRLHARGLADLVLATGDLVDYVYESQDFHRGHNFLFFEQLVRGLAGSEELRIPIYTVFGNHDYRLHPYELLAEVDVPGSNVEISQYSDHNITPDEAKALQGGKVLTVSKERAVDMLRIDPNGQGGHYDYYLNRINDQRNYTVRLGPHRIVMIDTGSDVGIPTGTDLGDMITLAFKSVTNSFSEDERQAKSGSPNQGGVGGGIDLVRGALHDPNGLVIIGMHGPPFSPPGGEYPYYLRETQHPTADARQIPEFLKRRKAVSENLAPSPSGFPTTKPPEGWINTGTAHFKVGLVEEGLDYGIAIGRIEEFVKLIAGVGTQRPADLILCGHQHDRVEFRLRWDPARNELQYFTDFYTENPGTYYFTINNFNTGAVPAGSPVHVRVRTGASPRSEPTAVTDHRSAGLPRTVYNIEVPPYASPLNSSTNAPAWWRNHRPLILQTAALGPIDRRQRYDPRWRATFTQPVTNVKLVKILETVNPPAAPWTSEPLPSQEPDTSFLGFRLIQVRDNTIARIRYVTLQDLRQRQFTMPWETEFQGPRVADGIKI